jgi:hypothetical protein
MNNLCRYVERFFDMLEVFEDIARGHNYKAYMREAVLAFLDSETKETAFAVYEAFFDSYRVTLKGGSNLFIDLLDVLRGYEENAATLIDKQRDHYIHSVNVFILGLCVYSQNANYRKAFDGAVMDKTAYPYSYDTKHEEFYYRWGLASLFHDVGYPVEIIGKQIGKFMGFATGADGSGKVGSHLEFDNFESLNTVAEVVPKREFTKAYFDKYDSCVYVDLLKPTDLRAQAAPLSRRRAEGRQGGARWVCPRHGQKRVYRPWVLQRSYCIKMVRLSHPELWLQAGVLFLSRAGQRKCHTAPQLL